MDNEKGSISRIQKRRDAMDEIRANVPFGQSKGAAVVLNMPAALFNLLAGPLTLLVKKWTLAIRVGRPGRRLATMER